MSRYKVFLVNFDFLVFAQYWQCSLFCLNSFRYDLRQYERNVVLLAYSYKKSLLQSSFTILYFRCAARLCNSRVKLSRSINILYYNSLIYLDQIQFEYVCDFTVKWIHLARLLFFYKVYRYQMSSSKPYNRSNVLR